MKIETLKESRKGAALVTDGNNVAWIKPAANKKLKDTGILPPAAAKTLAESEQTLAAFKEGKPLTDKKPYKVVKFSHIKKETAKAILVVDFQNHSAWLPKSCIADKRCKSTKSTGLYVADWWIQQNHFATSAKYSTLWI